MEEQNKKNISKEELVTIIKDWIKMDNDIKKLKNDIKDKNNAKKVLTENLMTVMKNNKIDCFDVTGGSIMYKQTKVKKPITGKTLLTAIQTFYKNNETVAEELTKHILENREEQIKETIKRKIEK